MKDLVVRVEFTDDTIYLHLADGRIIGNPLAWHPWLETAKEETIIGFIQCQGNFLPLNRKVERPITLVAPYISGRGLDLHKLTIRYRLNSRG